MQNVGASVLPIVLTAIQSRRGVGHRFCDHVPNETYNQLDRPVHESYTLVARAAGSFEPINAATTKG